MYISLFYLASFALAPVTALPKPSDQWNNQQWQMYNYYGQGVNPNDQQGYGELQHEHTYNYGHPQAHTMQSYVPEIASPHPTRAWEGRQPAFMQPEVMQGHNLHGQSPSSSLSSVQASQGAVPWRQPHSGSNMYDHHRSVERQEYETAYGSEAPAGSYSHPYGQSSASTSLNAQGTHQEQPQYNPYGALHEEAPSLPEGSKGGPLGGRTSAGDGSSEYGYSVFATTPHAGGMSNQQTLQMSIEAPENDLIAKLKFIVEGYLERLWKCFPVPGFIVELPLIGCKGRIYVGWKHVPRKGIKDRCRRLLVNGQPSREQPPANENLVCYVWDLPTLDLSPEQFRELKGKVQPDAA